VAFGVVSMSKRPELLVDAAAGTGCRLAFVGPCLPILAEVIEDRARVRGISGRVTVVGAVSGESWDWWMDQADLAVQWRDAASGETSAALLEALAAGVPVLTNMAAAAEYPAGTVTTSTNPDPADLAERIAELLGSPATLRDLSAAGQAFAADHQFHRLAQTLVGVVTG
jgi:glycosyltransferase involved in cell wall biosynthesis